MQESVKEKMIEIEVWSSIRYRNKWDIVYHQLLDFDSEKV